MESLLTPDKGLIVWTVVTFIIFVLVLGKFAWKPMIAALKEREDGIRKAMDDANSARLSADQLRAQYEKELAAGQQKAQALLQQTQTEAQKLRDKLMKEAEEESRKMLDNTKRQMDEEQAKVLRDLRTQVSKISIMAAEKLVRHSMTQKTQDQLLEDFFKNLDKQKN